VKIIAASGLFDEEYYRAAHPRIPPGVTDLVGHYCQWGWRKGSDPSENFHSRFYLTRHPDVRKSGMNPLLHYISSGAAESRPCQGRSNPWHEDPSYFRQTDADIRLVAFHAGTEWTEPTSPAPARHRASPALDIAEAAKTARSHGISTWCFTRDASSPTPPGSHIEKLLSDPRIDIGFLIALDLRRETLHENTLETLQRAFRDNRYQTFGEQPVLLLVLPPEPNGITATLAKLTGLTGAGQRPQPFLIARTDEASPEQPDAWSTLGIQATLDWPHDRHLRSEGMYAPRTSQGASTIPYRVIAGQSMATIYHGRRGPMPCYRVVNVGQDGWDGRSKRCIRYTRFNLPDYRQWLEAAIEETRDTLPADRRMVFIDAWNEHHRGAVLEPDPELGHGKLNETVITLLGLPKDRPCPPVSVVVPGSAPTACLRQRLACIYGQTYLNCVVLLVDDGASAETTALFEACVQHHPGTTRILRVSATGSVCRQWAAGIRSAKGAFIWIADDQGHRSNDFLERMLPCFTDDSVMLALARPTSSTEDGTGLPSETDRTGNDPAGRPPVSEIGLLTAHQAVCDGLGVCNTIPDPGSVVFRKPLDLPLLDDEEWLSMRHEGDWILYLNLIRGGRIAIVPDTIDMAGEKTSTAPDPSLQAGICKEYLTGAATVQRLYLTTDACREASLARFRALAAVAPARPGDDVAPLEPESVLGEARRTRSPNIAVSTYGLHPGGAEVIAIRIANELKRIGQSVMLLNMGGFPDQPEIRHLLRSDVPLVNGTDATEVKRVLTDFGIEVLNSHHWRVQNLPSVVPDVFRSLKAHVATLHGMIESGTEVSATGENIRRADANVSTWVPTADKNLVPFRELGLFEDGSKRYVKLPNGMSPSPVRPVHRAGLGIPEDAFVCCCVSRAIPEKGWEEAIEAIGIARDATGRDIRLVLVGEGEVYEKLMRSAPPGFVHLAGLLVNSVGLYAMADAGIMLTTYRPESFPLTVVECLFAGRPYIATDMGEIRRMLTVEAGLAGAVIERVDGKVPVDRVADTIIRFVQEPETYRSAVDRVPEAARRFTIEAVVR